MLSFPRSGKENTEATLTAAKQAARQHSIGQVVVASTTGVTGLHAVELFGDDPVRVVIVSHNAGFKDSRSQEFDRGIRKRIEERGGIVYTGTMVLRGLGTAIRGKGGYTYEQIVADTLRIMGQGCKVCVEIAAMAADAGLVASDDLIAVAGTGRGADTALLIKADSSNRFFDIKIREILAKPLDW